MTRVQEQDAPGSPAPLALAGIRARFPARPVTSGWPATTANREETLRRLTSAPFASDSAGTQKERVLGMSRRAGSPAAASTLTRGWGGCPQPC